MIVTSVPSPHLFLLSYSLMSDCNILQGCFEHSAPCVASISWVLKERFMGDDKSEVLVSVSVDGHLLQWSIHKGFESMQLMKLKRMVTPKLQQEKKTAKSKHTHGHGARLWVNPDALGQGEAYISQHAPGMGFDFWPRDSNMWVWDSLIPRPSHHPALQYTKMEGEDL